MARSRVPLLQGSYATSSTTHIPGPARRQRKKASSKTDVAAPRVAGRRARGDDPCQPELFTTPMPAWIEPAFCRVIAFLMLGGSTFAGPCRLCAYMRKRTGDQQIATCTHAINSGRWGWLAPTYPLARMGRSAALLVLDCKWWSLYPNSGHWRATCCGGFVP
jgi:hypothetical protein